MLFVDEDGNPIEAGHENVLYTDENGNELTEEIAINLLESGQYIDSRDLYQEILPNASRTDSQPSLFYPNSQLAASLPASAFGSLSKSTGARKLAPASNDNSADQSWVSRLTEFIVLNLEKVSDISNIIKIY